MAKEKYVKIRIKDEIYKVPKKGMTKKEIFNAIRGVVMGYNLAVSIVKDGDYKETFNEIDTEDKLKVISKVLETLGDEILEV